MCSRTDSDRVSLLRWSLDWHESQQEEKTSDNTFKLMLMTEM
jgi:hypothetical protein